MAHHILPGNPPVALVLRRSARARRISLRVSGVDGRVTLTFPRGVSDSEALRFAKDKENWLRGHLENRPLEVPVRTGAEIPLEGRTYRIVSCGGGGPVRIEARELLVPGPESRMATRLRAFLRELARDRLVEASDRYAKAIDHSYARITLRDTRSRWGSCSASGGLMYSWRLILAPPDVLDYVAAHEIAHLAEMNHSPDFWQLVAGICPGYEAHRRWLRKNGAALHRFQFGD